MEELLSAPSPTEVTMSDLIPLQMEILCLLISGNPLSDYDHAKALTSVPEAVLPNPGVMTC